MNKKDKSNHFFECRGEKYGFSCNINVVRKIQEEYESFTLWMTLAFGSDIWADVGTSKLRSDCSLLLSLITITGRVKPYYRKAALDLVFKLSYVYCVPVTCKKKGKSYFVEGHEQLEDIVHTGEVRNKKRIGMNASVLLDGVKIMVDEYVDEYNQKRIHNPKPPLDICCIGRLPLNILFPAVFSAINSSFPKNNRKC